MTVKAVCIEVVTISAMVQKAYKEVSITTVIISKKELYHRTYTKKGYKRLFICFSESRQTYHPRFKLQDINTFIYYWRLAHLSSFLSSSYLLPLERASSYRALFEVYSPSRSSLLPTCSSFVSLSRPTR